MSFGGNESCRVTLVKSLFDLARENLNRLLGGRGGYQSRVRCDKCSNGGGGVGRKMVRKRVEWKRSYHLQRIKYG